MDLILHIGFAKCASTTLQNGIFREAPGYLGAGVGIPKSLNFGKQFQHHCPLGGRRSFNAQAALAWRERVLEFLKDKGSLSCCVLSNENLSSSSREEEMPIVSSLEQFGDKVWSDGKLKVIVVLRNQIQRLGSLYSQFSQARIRAGQNDFERFVYDCLEGNKSITLRYSNWVASLRKSLGEENVSVLLLEDMDRTEFWQDIAKFCQLGSDVAQAYRIASNANRRNVSSVGDLHWKLRQLNLTRKSRDMTKFAINRLVPLEWPRLKVGLLHPPLFRFIHSINEIRAGLAGHTRPDQIVVTKKIGKAIFDFCAEDNSTLSQLLGRDLEMLGYPVL